MMLCLNYLALLVLIYVASVFGSHIQTECMSSHNTSVPDSYLEAACLSALMKHNGKAQCKDLFFTNQKQICDIHTQEEYGQYVCEACKREGQCEHDKDYAFTSNLPSCPDGDGSYRCFPHVNHQSSRCFCKNSRLNNACVTEVMQSSRQVGCFVDAAARDLDGPDDDDLLMTNEKCTQFCATKGFRYAGTQYSTQCFCGDSYGRYGTSTRCIMPCAGNATQICGGLWAISVVEIL